MNRTELLKNVGPTLIGLTAMAGVTGCGLGKDTTNLEVKTEVEPTATALPTPTETPRPTATAVPTSTAVTPRIFNFNIMGVANPEPTATAVVKAVADGSPTPAIIVVRVEVPKADPTATVAPTATEAAKAPEVKASVRYGIKLDARTGKYNLVDRESNRVIDPSTLEPATIVRQNKTEAGIRKTVDIVMLPGETVIAEGLNVNGHDGAYIAAENPVNATGPIVRTFSLFDGAATTVSAAEGAVLFAQSYNRAVEHGLAHGYVAYPASWNVGN